MGRKALFRLPLRLSCGPRWDFSDSLGETVRKGVRVALRLQIWCVYGGRYRLKRAFGRPVGLRCRPLRVFSDSLSAVLLDEVPKVTQALGAPFWHFWHPRRLAYSEKHTRSSVLHNYTRGPFFILPWRVDRGALYVNDVLIHSLDSSVISV